MAGTASRHGQQEALIARRGQACGLDKPRPQVVKARALVRDALRLVCALRAGCVVRPDEVWHRVALLHGLEPQVVCCSSVVGRLEQPIAEARLVVAEKA